MAGIQIDGVNNKIDFDDDLDTSISANTDDTLVFEIAGANDFSITANSFNVLTGSSVSLADECVLNIGTGNDLQIAHDGNNSSIKDTGTGSLIIQTNSFEVKNAGGNESLLLGTEDGAVNLYHNNAVKLATTASGVDITGVFTATAASTITTADNTDTLSLISTDADANSGPNLVLYRNSSSPEDGNQLGHIHFKGRNDNSQDVTYAKFLVHTNDVSDGEEDGDVFLQVMTAGTLQNYVSMLAVENQPEVVINDGSIDMDFRVESNGNANMLFVDGGNDRVGVGTNAPAKLVHIVGAADNGLLEGLQLDNTDHASTETGQAIAINLRLSQAGTMRDGGRITVGKDDDWDNAAATDSHMTFKTMASNTLTERMKIASDGDIILNAGNIDSSTADLKIYSSAANHCGIRFAQGAAVPISNDGGTSDGAIGFGAGSYRWSTIFASTGSINTSDKNEKQDIEELTDAEKKVAVVAKGLLRKYKFKDAVEKKGDKARTHFGIIAQDLEDAFTAESLDASKYGMFCSDTWWETQTEVAAVEAVEEVTDEEGNVTTEAVEAKDAYTRTDAFETLEEAPEGATERTRLGVRYSELLAFIITAI